MRRRPQRLQVSTFPFLAVLLCAMGSLILLLLVIDRRAKVVARQKALQAAQAAAAGRIEEDQKRKDEWERQRQALHALLAGQFGELQEQVNSVHVQIRDAHSQVQGEKAQLDACERNLVQAQELLARERAALAARQASAGEAAAKDAQARAELQRLAGELVQLEQTLRALQALRESQKQTYSLVPYKGRKGDRRTPLYIECTATGLTFHFERGKMPGPILKGMDLRHTVEACLRQMPQEDQETAPYLLFLVRPDGIRTYNAAQSALQTMK